MWLLAGCVQWSSSLSESSVSSQCSFAIGFVKLWKRNGKLLVDGRYLNDFQF